MSDDVQVGDYIGNVACEDCGSKDNLSIYTKIDRDDSTYIDGYCWGTCHFDGSGYKNKSKIEEMGYTSEESIAAKITKPKLTPEQIEYILDQIKSMPINGLKTRRLKRVTMERYGVHSEMNGQVTQSLYFPSSVDGDIVGFKLKDLSGARKEPYAARGSVKKTNELFGQRLFNKGGKFLIITEGECDAMAFYQALSERSNGKYETACVSINNGSGSVEAQIKANYEWVTSFEKVLIAFDNDDPGKIATEIALKLLKPSQSYRVNFTRYKDANEYVIHGQEAKLVDDFWKAEKFSPVGIIGSSQTFNALVERAKFVKIALPDFAEDLQLMMNGGIALGEITTIAAACVDSETEYLTKNGWNKISEFSKDDEIAIVDNSLNLRFEEPQDYINEECDWMYHFKTKYGIDQMVSANHRIPHISVGGVFKVKTADEIVENHRSNSTGFRGNFIQVFDTIGGKGLDFTEGELRLQVAVNADGRIVKNGANNYTQMRFRKKRKYIRLLEMCEKFGLKHDDRGWYESERTYQVIVWPKSNKKSFNGWYEASKDQLRIIADEVLNWDGTKIHSNAYFSKNKEDVDFIQYVFSSCGYRSSVCKGDNVWECHVKSIRKGDTKRGVGMGMSAGQSGKPEVEKVTPVDGRQYCFTTTTGFWLARRNGNVFMTGNSSVGKTTMVNEFLYHFIMTSPYKVGIISLESDVGELTENLMSLHISKKLANMPDDEKLKLFHSNGFDSAYKDLTHTEEGNDRYYILDHQGAVVDGELMKNIEFLVKSMDCKVIILDPLTLALSGKQNDGMDVFMSDLLRFVKREKVAHVNVVHVRKNQSGSKANSTGAEIHEEDIKGSGSIFQVSMNNILLMRDKENVDPLIRNTTKAMMSKNRRCGNTGPAGFWFYNSETSRMEKGRDPQTSYEDSLNEFEELGAFEESNLDLVGQDVDNGEESKDNEGYVFKSPD